MKKLKIVTLLLDVIGIGASIYYKRYLLLCFLTLMLFYFLYIFWKREENEKVSNFNKRATYITNIIVFLAILIVVRLIQVQIFDAKKYEQKAMGQIIGKDILVGDRGNIYDTTGKSLAYNRHIYTVAINPSTIYDRDSTLKGIKELLEQDFIVKDKKVLLDEILRGHKANRKYKVVAKNITEKEREKVDEIARKYNLTGNDISFERNIERKYYKNDIYDNIIGFIGYTAKNGANKTGIFGIEKQYENYLKEKVLIRQNVYVRNRNFKLPMAKDFLKMDLNGNNVYMTIDNDIQFILSEELKKKFILSQSDEAYGVVMDPNNGKILALSSYTINKKRALRNPIFQNQFEPGSTFKPLIVAAAMDKGLIDKDTLFDVGDGRIRKYNHTIRESSRSTKGILTTEQVLKKSSNVGMVLIGDKFTNQEFEEYLKKYGLYEKTGIDFPGEIKPFTTPYKRWDGLKKSTMSFGQGIVVTPIQLITAFSSVINGGILYKPYMVEKITDNSGVVIKRNSPVEVRRVIDEKVSLQLRGMLEQVVADGTAKKGAVLGYRVGGKTGTAQLSGKGGYLKENYLASFIGFFPADKPKYVVLVMFLKPKGESIFEKYGGATAAPVFGDIVSRITKTKNIISQDISKISKPKMGKKEEATPLQDVVMPDLKGFNPKDVIYIFKDTNIEVKVQGTGLVDKQYPEAGATLEGVEKVKIILK